MLFWGGEGPAFAPSTGGATAGKGVGGEASGIYGGGVGWIGTIEGKGGDGGRGISGAMGLGTKGTDG